MYCPRCGNQPANDRVRFCPNCGFRLDGVVDLLIRDGVPTNPINSPQIKEISPRRRGIRTGGKILFFSIVLFLPALALAIDADSPVQLLLSGTILLTGIFWMLYFRLFGDEYSTDRKTVQYIQHAPPQQPKYLPPQQSVPVNKTPIGTPQQQSVVENTTRSLGQS